MESQENQTFNRENVSEQSFSGVKFSECNFENCIFLEHDFRGSHFFECCFKGCNLHMVKMEEDNWSIDDINEEKIEGYLFDTITLLKEQAIIGVSADTLYRRCQTERGASFSAILQEKRAKGDAYLKLKQFSLAMQGDRGLLIWLGKQRLEQRDRPEEALSQAPSIQVVHFGNESVPKACGEQQSSLA